MLTWYRALGHRARHERSPVLEVVRRRQAQRLLQLRRPAPGQVQEQGGADLRARAGGRDPLTRSRTRSSTSGSTSSPRCCATSCGLKAGDRVTIHMPMVAELPITMLACARLGVIHSVVFGGFSGEACGLRAADSGSRVLIYMDGYYRSGKIIDHKASADIAVATAAERTARRSTRSWSGGGIPARTARRRRWSRGRDYLRGRGRRRTIAGKRSSPCPWTRRRRSS